MSGSCRQDAARGSRANGSLGGAVRGPVDGLPPLYASWGPPGAMRFD